MLMDDPKTIEKEVAGLGGLTLSQLRERWEVLYGSPPPQSLREQFLVKACAYQMQAKAYGGLSKSAKRRLRKIADDVHAGKPVGDSSQRRIKPGTRLVRAWGGKVHTVTVIAGGFEYSGEHYTSLSAIAREITGTSWNGPTFFGLNGEKRAAKGGQGARTPDQAPTMPKLQPTGDTAPVSRCESHELEKIDV